MTVMFFAQKLAQSKFINRQVDMLVSNNRNLAMLLVASTAAKDAFQYGIQVNQSLNNQKIPQDKRKFVAALDAANGVLMSLSQLGMGLLVVNDRLQTKICNKLFGQLLKTAPEKFLECKAGFTIFSSLIVTAIIVKRFLVPLIATPLASWIKEEYLKNDDISDHHYFYKA